MPVPIGTLEVVGAVAGPIGVGGNPVPVPKLEVVELPPNGGRKPDDAEDDGAIGAVPLEVGTLEPVTGEFAELELGPVPLLIEMVMVSLSVSVSVMPVVSGIVGAENVGVEPL